MKINQLQQIRRAQQIQRSIPQNRPATESAGAKTDFKSILDEQVSHNGSVKFSNHAMQRIEQRQIPFTQADFGRLNKAVDIAAEKGAKESLVLMDNRGLVVSIPNRTVITAVDHTQLKNNVFTNIDSTVVV